MQDNRKNGRRTDQKMKIKKKQTKQIEKLILSFVYKNEYQPPPTHEYQPPPTHQNSFPI